MNYTLKILAIFLFTLFIQACGATRVNYTVFLKETDTRLYNLKGEDCQQSGLKLDEKGKRLITYYANCSVHQERALEEFEPQQWIPPKKSGEESK